jgi:hypothetical protein
MLSSLRASALSFPAWSTSRREISQEPKPHPASMSLLRLAVVPLNLSVLVRAG